MSNKLSSKLIKEWHPTRNYPLVPENFKAGSSKKVWWKCSKGDDHEWEAGINDRTGGHGCPFCSNLKVSKTNSLAKVNSQLAREWHPTRNGLLLPENFKAGSNKKVWWKCLRFSHEWESTIANRSRGSGCPYCHNEKKSKKV